MLPNREQGQEQTYTCGTTLIAAFRDQLCEGAITPPAL
jgi:hypothetical protein